MKEKCPRCGGMEAVQYSLYSKVPVCWKCANILRLRALKLEKFNELMKDNTKYKIILKSRPPGSEYKVEGK